MPTSPTLLVGLGTSGMKVVSEVEKLMYSTFGCNSLPDCHSLYLETDVQARPEPTPAGTAIKQVTIAAESLKVAISNLRNNPDLDLDWISDELPAQWAYNKQGAGNIRPAGRLLLWNDFASVYSALAESWKQVNTGNTAVAGGAQGGEGDVSLKSVYVIGTLVGGSCSGTFLDIGYMLKKITSGGMTGISKASQVRLFGVFLIPIENAPNMEALCANTYGALLEMDHYRGRGHRYDEKWPNGVSSGENIELPFDHVYLASPEYGDGSGAMEIKSCYSVTAMKLFCDIVGMNAEIGNVTVNAAGNRSYSFFHIRNLCSNVSPVCAQ